jgi:hypothetical protein
MGLVYNKAHESAAIKGLVFVFTSGHTICEAFEQSSGVGIVMRRFFGPMVVASLLAPSLLYGCKPRADAHQAQVKRIEFTQAKAAESAQIRCQSVANATNRNICFLTEYARALLSQTTDYDDISNQVREKLEKKGIKKFLPMSTYRITPKQGGVCFNSESHPVESENFWNNQVEPLRKQIEHVAEFLAQYHVDLDGQDPGPFGIRDVELCPITITEGRKISLHGSTLTVGLPVKGLISTTYGWYSFIELRKMWDRGEMFERRYSVKHAVVDLFAGKEAPFLWQLGNPVGQVRNALRNFLRTKGQDLIARLEKIQGSSSRLSSADQEKTIRAVMHLDESSPEANQNYIPEILKESKTGINGILEAGKGAELISEWLCLAKDALNSPEISSAAVGELMERSDSTKVRYDIKASWVAVANFHNINVDVFGAYSNQNRFIEIPKSSSQSLDFQVRAEGRVVVVTGDQVNVSTAMSYLMSSVQRTIQSDTLYKAVRNVAKVPDRGQWCSSRQAGD